MDRHSCTYSTTCGILLRYSLVAGGLRCPPTTTSTTSHLYFPLEPPPSTTPTTPHPSPVCRTWPPVWPPSPLLSPPPTSTACGLWPPSPYTRTLNCCPPRLNCRRVPPKIPPCGVPSSRVVVALGLLAYYKLQITNYSGPQRSG